eukprot:1463378-Rhodomonas_salina.1
MDAFISPSAGFVPNKLFKGAADHQDEASATQIMSHILDLSGDNLKHLLDTFEQNLQCSCVQEAGCMAVGNCRQRLQDRCRGLDRGGAWGDEAARGTCRGASWVFRKSQSCIT